MDLSVNKPGRNCAISCTTPGSAESVVWRQTTGNADPVGSRSEHRHRPPRRVTSARKVAFGAFGLRGPSPRLGRLSWPARYLSHRRLWAGRHVAAVQCQHPWVSCVSDDGEAERTLVTSSGYPFARSTVEYRRRRRNAGAYWHSPSKRSLTWLAVAGGLHARATTPE